MHEPESTERHDAADDRRCTSQKQGHNPALVQLLRGLNDPTNRFVPCTITDIDDEGWFTVVIDGEASPLRFWHHDPSRIRHLADNRESLISPRWKLIGSVSPAGTPAPCASISHEPTGCYFEDASGDLFDQLLTHGGGVVRLDD